MRPDLNPSLTASGLNLIAQGMTIYDQDLRLAVCNAPFQKMFDLPDTLVTPGATFHETITHLAACGEYGALDDIDAFARVVAWIVLPLISTRSVPFRMLYMPHKFNADYRDKIPKQKHRVTNWAIYNENLRRRGDLTIWISEDALGVWSPPRRTARGGQPRYFDLAIELCLTLGVVFANRYARPKD